MFSTARRWQATPAYNALIKCIKGDLKQAMIAKQKTEKNTIRSVLSTIKNSEIDGAAQNEFEVARVLNKMIRQRLELAKAYTDQNRSDLASVEMEESGIIRKYVESLPVASEEDLTQKVVSFLNQLKSADPKMPAGAVFRMVTEEKAAEWGASLAVAKAVVAKNYKQVF